MKLPEIQTVWAPEAFDIKPNILTAILGGVLSAISCAFEYEGFFSEMSWFGLGLAIASTIPIFVNQYFTKKRNSKNG